MTLHSVTRMLTFNFVTKTLTFQLRHENIDIPTSSRLSVTVPISTSSRKCQSAAGSALSCAAVNLCMLLNQINFINENLLGASWIFIYEIDLDTVNSFSKCLQSHFDLSISRSMPDCSTQGKYFWTP